MDALWYLAGLISGIALTVIALWSLVMSVGRRDDE